jgi:hypothetical protein
MLKADIAEVTQGTIGFELLILDDSVPPYAQIFARSGPGLPFTRLSMRLAVTVIS